MDVPAPAHMTQACVHSFHCRFDFDFQVVGIDIGILRLPKLFVKIRADIVAVENESLTVL